MKSKTISIACAILIPLLFILLLQIVGVIHVFIPEKFNPILLGILGTMLSLAITFSFLKFEKSTFRDIGLFFDSKTLKKTLKGFLIGAIIACLMIGSIIVFSDLKIDFIENKNLFNALSWLLVFIPLAFMEEVIFRGYAFIKLNKLVGLRITQVIIAILFAYYHDFTGSTFTSQLLGPGVWAIIYGWAAIKSDGIALPTGIHISANMILAVVGLKDERYSLWQIEYATEITTEMQNNTEIVGISVQILLLIVGIILTEWYIRNKRNRAQNIFYI